MEAVDPELTEYALKRAAWMLHIQRSEASLAASIIAEFLRSLRQDTICPRDVADEVDRLAGEGSAARLVQAQPPGG